VISLSRNTTIFILLAIVPLIAGTQELICNCVSENNNYLQTIQEAINRAEPGETIHVPSGVYFEHLVINKSISLVGENLTSTILDGNGTGILVEILSDNVSLHNFTLRNAEKIVTLINVKNCEVQGNIIANITNSTHGTGIRAQNCENIRIYENIFDSLDCYNIYFSQTRKSFIEENMFNANKRWSQPIFLYFSEENVIESNNVSGYEALNEGGIGLLYSNNNLIRYNYIFENDWVGLSLRYSNCNVIEGNTITKHTWYGLKMENCRENNVHWNNFLSNYKHANIKNCENITWSLEKFGNYWDNYAGKDLDMNGVGEEPYQIDSENFDFFPLMGKFHNYKIGYDHSEGEIFIISNSTIENPIFIRINESASIVFNASGRQGTIGFCLTKFSKSLIEPPYNVEINGYSPVCLFNYSDDANAILYFAYLHQNQSENIKIIPEFNSILMLAIFCTLSLLIIRRK